MASTTPRPKLVVIVGPTASGKSALAQKVAKEFRGEIIAADSRTIYEGMDIGTAKATPKDQKEVAYWGLDLTKPGEIFSAYQFKSYAEAKVKEVQKRGKLPILVGGTGLYIDSVLFDFGFLPTVDPGKRKELEQFSSGQLQALINKYGYKMPQNSQNHRHLVRAIERKGQAGTKKRLKEGVLLIGLMPAAKDLQHSINNRAKSYFNQGLAEETKQLMNTYGEQALLNSGGIAYKAATKLIKGEITEQDAIQKIQKEEWQYARRQRTWFKRNKFIRWFDDSSTAYQIIRRQLNN